MTTGSTYQVRIPTDAVIEVPRSACQRPSATSMIRKTALAMAGMSSASPTTSIRSATMTSANFCRLRKTIRWNDTGAMKIIVATAVVISATVYRPRSKGPMLGEPLGEGQAQQEREEDLHAGEGDAELLQQLRDVAVQHLVERLPRASAARTAAVGSKSPARGAAPSASAGTMPSPMLTPGPCVVVPAVRPPLAWRPR